MYVQDDGLEFGEEHWPVTRIFSLCNPPRPPAKESELLRRRLEHEREINRLNVFGQE